MRRILLLAFVCFVILWMSSSTSVAQAAPSTETPILQWEKTYGGSSQDRAYSVIQTSDGGYAITGVTESFGAGGQDVWLVKTDACGEVQWSKAYGNATHNEVGMFLIQTTDGGYAITGYTGRLGIGHEGWDYWLVKTDGNGNMIWNRTYAHGEYQDEARCVIQTGDGGYAIAGYTHYELGIWSPDAWVIKTDAAGNTIWNKTYGGSSHDGATSIIQTQDGGYAICGCTYSFDVQNGAFWLVKIDANGDMVWYKTYDNGWSLEVAYSVVQTSDGGYALFGLTESGDWDFWLVKTDGDGNVIWNKTYGGTGKDFPQGNRALIQTEDQGFIMVGGTSSDLSNIEVLDFWLVKTDEYGNVQWSKTYGGTKDDWPYSLIQTCDGGYAIVGYTESFGAGAADFWLIKLAPQKHYLAVNTEPSNLVTIPGEGWHDKGTDVELTAPSFVPGEGGENGIRYRFDYWTVDGSIVFGNPITVQMDANHTATAHYVRQYFLTVISPYDTPGGEGWYDENETAYATLAVGLDYTDAIAYGFVGWSGDASGWDLISDPIVMDAPKMVIANWEASTAYGDVRTIGYWKHQVNVWYFTELKNSGIKIRGIGTAQISEEALITYLTFIDSNSDYFRGKIVGATNLDTLRNAYNILKTPTGPDSMKMRAEQQLFAVWLNLAHNAFFWNTQLSQDTLYIYWNYTYDENNGLATIGEAILYCETELLKPNGNYEAAKNICDSINNNLGIIWGT